MYRPARFALALLALAALLAACSSTTLSGSWKDPEFHGQIRKVYIVGVARQEINRRMFEDSFGKGLQAFGVTGISSYRDLPAAETADKDAIAAQVGGSGADSILMARMTGKRTEQVVNPGYVSGYAYGYGGGPYAPAPYYQNWGSYYDRRYEAVYMPATVSEFEIATIEANLYDAKTGKLVWSAQLETVIDSDLQKLFSDFVKTVTKDLQQQGLL